MESGRGAATDHLSTRLSTLHGVVFAIFVEPVDRACCPFLIYGARLRNAGEKGFFSGMNRIRGSNMHPDAVEAQAEQPLLLVGAVEQFGQREFACRGSVEQRRRNDRGN